MPAPSLTPELIRNLLKAAAYPHDATAPDLIETHISWVILAGEFAYKIKKPVDLDFLDFSTLDLRRHFCAEELRLNRRFAPSLYLDVVAIELPKFSDGRGYSIARLLRERLSYRNELRAVGDVLLDQLQFMKRCGFDTYVLRADKDINKAARCLNFFTQGYQAATDTDEPLFRRRAS